MQGPLSVFFFAVVWTTLPLCASTVQWTPQGGQGKVQVKGADVSLELKKSGRACAVAGNVPVRSGERMSMGFKYSAQGVTGTTPFRVEIRWFDAAGEDVDDARRPLGFSALVRVWDFTRNKKQPVRVADNFSVPDRAVKARISLSVTHQPSVGVAQEKPLDRPVKVQVSDFHLEPGETQQEGLDLPESGPPDAGPLSQPPSGHAFAKNLASNATLEEGGVEGPQGWKIEGDNRNNSAEWISGGAFSGKHALKISDRGPYVKSWDRSPGDPYVAGGPPRSNYALAREEVSARWTSTPVPAEPGKAYQASAFYWYANRHEADEGVPNPVRIQFLNKEGRVLPDHNIWSDWFPYRMAVMSFPGWIFLPGKPVVAPPEAASLRVVVALNHAFYDNRDGTLRQRPQEMGFVLVDNIAVYVLPENTDPKDANLAFSRAAAAGAVPFVPSSPRHRPNTVEIHTVTKHPGGLLIREQNAAASATESPNLKIRNLLGDVRHVEVSYTIVDIDGKQVGQGRGAADLPPYGSTPIKIALPPDLRFGPYELRYTLHIDGENQTLAETTRFGIMPARHTTVAERGRMDYPFSLWMHTFADAIGKPQENILGRLAESAGMGKTWFGCGGMIYPKHFLAIADPEERRQALADRIVKARRAIAAWKKYGVTPLGGIQNTNLLDPSQYPVLEEIVGTFVGDLKEDIGIWRHGTEAMHGGVRELDRATVGKGLSGQGGTNYLYWGRKGTVRQYWHEYFLAYAAAKKANPQCLFGPQCASDTQGNVLRLFFQVGTRDQIDIFGMNTYLSAFSIWPSNLMELKKNGMPDLPLYISEFSARTGAPMTGPNHLEAEKKASGDMVTYWASTLFRFPSFFHMEMWGMVLADEDRSLTYQGLVRPQYLAYATMTNLLGAGKFVAKYNPANAEIYIRHRSVREGFVAVAWTKSGTATVDLDAGSNPVTVYDLWGNVRELTPVDNVVTLDLTRDPVYLVSSAEIKPASTVAIVIDHATVQAGQPKLRVVVTNEQDKAVSGTLELLANGPLRISDRQREIPEIPPGQSVEFLFDINPVGELSDRRIHLRARILSGTKVYESSAALNFHTAIRGTEPPDIDGNNEWDREELSQVVNRKDQVTTSNGIAPWGGAGDLSARAGFRWDENNLYMIFQVRDDVYQPPSAENTMWNRDVIELLVDVSRGLSGESPLTMFSLSRFPDGARLLRHDGSLSQGKVPGGRIAISKNGDTVLYEAAIPWNEIQRGFRPQAGTTISLAWGIDDFDGGNSGKDTLSWFTNVSKKDASQFGDLTLVDGASQ